MNYLAHFHLAWPDPGLIAGALEGDYRKGLLRGELPAAIEQGVHLHRAVDAFTDHHPIIEYLRRQFPDDLRRYAGIVIDISFDHFLCTHWEKFSSVARADFNSEVYVILGDALDDLSPPAQRMAIRMAEIDLLDRYTEWETVTASALRIGERFKRGNPFHNLAPALAPLAPLLEQAFLEFYPMLVGFAEEY